MSIIHGPQTLGPYIEPPQGTCVNFSDTDPGPRPEASTAMHFKLFLLRAIYFQGLAHATVKVAYMVVASQAGDGGSIPLTRSPVQRILAQVRLGS